MPDIQDMGNSVQFLGTMPAEICAFWRVLARALWRLHRGVLEALGPQGDGNGKSMVSIPELKDYVSRRLPDLTRGAQTPSIESRFQGDLFATDM